MVNGMRPAVAGDTQLMVFQAYLDDSVSDLTKGDYFVLAGHVASAEQWAAFSKEWETLLPWATVNPITGVRRFKMAEMGSSTIAKERVAAFYRVIEDNVTASISVRMKLSALENAKRRVVIPGINMKWDFFKGPYNFAFKALMDVFHTQKPTFAPEIPADEPVDFIFDRQTEMKAIYEIWEQYLATREPDARKRYGAVPRFEDDEDFLPLQGADLWAGAVRRWAEQGDGAWEKMRNSDFGQFKAKRRRFKLDLELTEEDCVKNILLTVKASLPGAVAYDLDLSVPREFPWMGRPAE